MGARDKHRTTVKSWCPQCKTHCQHSRKWSSRKRSSSSSYSGTL